MTEESMLIAVIQAASAGFSEGLVRACRAMVSRDGVGIAHGDSLQPIPETRHQSSESTSSESDSDSDSSLQEREVDDHNSQAVNPYELERAMSAMTKPVPDGMYDPMVDTEARPAWLQ